MNDRLRAALAAFALTGFATAALAQDAPQSLPKIRLNAGIHNIDAQLAQTPEQREIGLMFRPAMPVNEGMLFAFERPAKQCFWMKNTLIPLDAAFVDDNGAIVNIEQMKPQSLASHCSDKPVRFVLEMNDGWFAKRGVKPGARLKDCLSDSSSALLTKRRTLRTPDRHCAQIQKLQPKFFAAKSQFTSEPRKVSAHFGRALR